MSQLQTPARLNKQSITNASEGSRTTDRRQLVTGGGMTIVARPRWS